MESELQVFKNTSDNFSNNLTSISAVYINPDIKRIYDILIIIIVVTLMAVMGTDISWKQIWEHIRRPVGPILGVICQFVIMPFAGYIYNKIFQFESNLAVGLLIISCCPGGALSNTFTYYTDGDVPLSVTMTSISTVLALFLMPLNIWIYSKDIDTRKLVIPYFNLVISLIMITSPLTLGMLIKWKMPKASVYITKWGSFLVLILIGVTLALQLIGFPFQLNQITWKLFIVTIFLPITGFLIAYFLSFVSRRPYSTCIAIAIESGFQNIFVAVSVMLLSFDIKKHISILLMPTFYGLFETILGLLVVVVYRIIIFLKRTEYNEANKEEVEEVQKSSLIMA